MKTNLLIATFLLVLSACVTNAYKAEELENLKNNKNNQVLLLNDGSILIIDRYGKMRMFDPEGEPIRMNDGIEMELKNGDLIMMKSNLLWRVYPGKVHDHHRMK